MSGLRIVGICVLMGAALWGAAKYVFWEPSGAERDSWIYAFKVPASAKQFVLWYPESVPRYDVRLGDGPAPSHTVIRYQASVEPAALAATLVANGYSCERLHERALSCERKQGTFLLAQVTVLAEKHARSSVTIYLPDDS